VGFSGSHNQKEPRKNNAAFAIHAQFGLKLFRFVPILQKRYHLGYGGNASKN
jgi:hypothetical protein